MPKTSQVNWGFCIPSSCSHQELELILKEKLDNFFNSSAIDVKVQVRKNMCQTKQTLNQWNSGTRYAV